MPTDAERLLEFCAEVEADHAKCGPGDGCGRELKAVRVIRGMVENYERWDGGTNDMAIGAGYVIKAGAAALEDKP